MKKPQTAQIIITAVLMFFLLLFLLSLLSVMKTDIDILSPIIALLTAVIVFYTYIKAARKQKVSLSLMFLSLALFVWGIGDIIGLVLIKQGLNPADSDAVIISYTLTNILILTALSVFSLKYFNKWNLAQFTVDLVIVSIITLQIVWCLFLGQDSNLLRQMFQEDYTSILALITDMLMFISVITWYLARRTGKISSYITIIADGIILFSVVDAMYYFTYFKGYSSINQWINLFYYFSFCIIAYGSIKKFTASDGINLWPSQISPGNSKSWAYLYLFPVVVIFIWVTGLSKNIDLLLIIRLVVEITIYRIISRYVLLSDKYHKLLQSEKTLTETLERRVEEQVRQLNYLTNRDTLTGLYNRAYFFKRC